MANQPPVSASPPERAGEVAEVLARAFACDPLIGCEAAGRLVSVACLSDLMNLWCMFRPNRSVAERGATV